MIESVFVGLGSKIHFRNLRTYSIFAFCRISLRRLRIVFGGMPCAYLSNKYQHKRSIDQVFSIKHKILLKDKKKKTYFLSFLHSSLHQQCAKNPFLCNKNLKYNEIKIKLALSSSYC